MEAKPAARAPLTPLQIGSAILGILLLGWLSVAPVLASILGMLVLRYTPDTLTFLFGLPARAGVLPEPLIGAIIVLLTLGLEALLFVPLWMLFRKRPGAGVLSAVGAGGAVVSLYLAIWALAGIPFADNADATFAIRLVAGLLFAGLLFLALRRDAPAGIGRPPLSTLLLGLGAGLILLIPWMILGALGTLAQTLAAFLPALSYGAGEELLLRGILAALVARATGRPRLGFLIAFTAGVAMQPGYILPLGDWLALLRVFGAVAVAFLATELAARGSLWPAIVVHTAYEYGYPGFVDSRLEFSLPHPAALESIGLALFLALFFFGWRILAGTIMRIQPAAWRRIAAGAFFLIVLSASTGGYIAGGRPGLVQDGFLIIFQNQPDLSAASGIADRTAKGTYVFQTLTSAADNAQSAVRAELDRLGVSYRPHYLINMIEVRGRQDLMGVFAKSPGVAQVIPNPDVRIVRYAETMSIQADSAPGTGVEWNIAAVGAPQVWDAGVSGTGITVGDADTGVDWTHPALQSAYRGWNGGTPDHDFNWYDPWDGTAFPTDDYGHGTHTMGIVLGRDGTENQIGVAPGAQWIGCRNMRNGIGNPAAYVACMEFFLAPFPLGGDPLHDGRPELAPQVVSNSWGCPQPEGCSTGTLKIALDAMQAAGIFMAVAAGNDGPACGTAGVPPANYASAFTVGAVDDSNALVFFSSRGPVGSLMKPQISAPGWNVRSSIPGGLYSVASGTSMAAPHVAGAVALLWSADPALIGDITHTADLLTESAVPETLGGICPADQSQGTQCLCGSDTATAVPNNGYGAGVINVYRAYQLIKTGNP